MDEVYEIILGNKDYECISNDDVKNYVVPKCVAKGIRADERKKVIDEVKRVIYSMDFDFGDFYDHTRKIKEMIAEALDWEEGENGHE